MPQPKNKPMRSLLFWTSAGIVIILAWSLTQHSASIVLDLIPPAGEPERPSIFEAIQQQLHVAAETLLDYENLPPMPTSTEGLKLAPGAADALFGSGDAKNNEWKIVREVVKAINAGRLSDWRVAEKNVGKIQASSCIDTVLSSLTTSDITSSVRKVFWEMARGSRNYEAVKWGIGIASVGLQPNEVADLLILARHAEFTLYASHALLRESEAHPEFKKHLVALLPISYGWGVVKVIEYIVRDKSLIGHRGVQRDVLIHGMHNCESIPMEIAFTIAKAINLRSFCLEAGRDGQLYRALTSLMDTLVNEPDPLGGLAQLDQWPPIYDAYVTMIGERPVDARLLVALSSLEHFLDDKKLNWPRRLTELDKVRRMFDERLSPAVLRRDLGSEEGRWAALQIIREKSVRDLLPDVEAAFNKKPDFETVQILGELGGRQQLEVMLKRIPSLVDLEARRSVPFSMVNVFGPEYKDDFLYAQIIEALGRLATPPALERIKAAASDLNPQVRSAACNAIAQLPLTSLDDELRAAVKARLNDSPQYVADAARKAAKHVGTPVPPASPKKSD